MALSYLLETLVEQLSSLLVICQLEGDAAFAYLEESKLAEAKSLLELIDQTYLAFREKALSLYAGATCPCRACKALPTLDLKFMVHHGDYVIQQLAGAQQLLGTDVNLIHRLAKNRVTESTGWKGYALFTDQVMERMQHSRDNFFKQSESYEHLGKVEIYCMDMHPRYAEMKDS